MAGATVRGFVDLFEHNRLVENDLALAGERVDLGNVDMPAAQIIGASDPFLPPAASVSFNDAIPSDDVAVFELPVGHVDLSVSETAHEQLWPRVCDWMAAR